MASTPPPPQPEPQEQQREQLYKTLHQALTNIGKSLTCPLCLSTYNDPVLLPCVHTYCRGCITQSLSHKPQCPTCAFKCTKRSIVDSPIFIDMVKSYKVALKSMGWTPIIYSPSLGMTQLPESSQEDTPNQEECHLHYQVSKTWQRVLESSSANHVLRQQQAAVVAVDQRALAAAKMGKEEEEEGSQALMFENKTLEAGKDDNVTRLRLGGTNLSRRHTDAFLDAKSVDDDDETSLGEDNEEKDIPTVSSHILTTPANDKSHDEAETTMNETIQDITTIIANQNLVLATPSVAKANATDGTCPRNNKTRSDSNNLVEETILVRQDSPRPESPMVENSESMAFFTAESQTDPESQMNSDSQEANNNNNAPIRDGEMVAPSQLGNALRDVRVDGETVARSIKSTQEANDVPRNARTESEAASSVDNKTAPRSCVSTQEITDIPRNVRAESEAVARTENVAPSDSETGYRSDSEPASHVDNEEAVDSASVTGEPDAFPKGTIVQVQDRTWPGVNKPGGVARITKIHREGAVIAYDVAYVLGGREKNVEAVFVSEQQSEKKRRVVNDENEFSPELKASLSAEGFDTEGKVKLDEVKRVEMKSGAKRKVLDAKKTVENAEPEVNPKKQRKGEKTKKAASKKCEKQRLPSPAALSDEQKCVLANSHYEERFRVAEGESLISVVTSSLPEGDLEMLRLLCKVTKGLDVQVKSTETFHVDKTTLVIMPVDSQRSQDYPTSRTRTLKAMRAMLAGVPIVSAGWISACLDKGKVVVPSPEMYIRTVPAKTTEPSINDFLGASLCAARIQQAGTLPQCNLVLPLSNAHVLLCGQYNRAEGSPRKIDVQVLLRESGATLLPSAGAAIKKLKTIGDNDSYKVVVLCDDCQTDERCGISDGLYKEVMAAMDRDHQRVVVVSSAWLFDSISCGGMILSLLFEPCSPRAKELWEAGNQPTAS